jgi:hypothetical protein
MSVETLEDLVGVVFGLEDDATVASLANTGPIMPSCRKANESSPFCFVILDGRGGGDRLPIDWSCCDVREDILLRLEVTSDGLNPSEIPIASKSYSSSPCCMDNRIDILIDALLSTPDDR